jgi:lipoate-protein ligase A
VSWRVLCDGGGRDPSRNLALDEALARLAGSAPTLRLWRNARCVVVGRSQVAEAEVDEEACRRLDVPVYRRFSGGGAVYHDEGNLNVSVVLSRDDPLLRRRPARRSLPGLYAAALEPLANAVRALGIPAVATEREVAVGGRKVSGVAAWLGRGSVLVHATLLVAADLALLERVLAGPGAPGDRRWERTRSRPAEVTSLACEGLTPAGCADVDRAVVAAFAAFEEGDARLTHCAPRTTRPGEPAEHELCAAEQLYEERYSDPAWHLTGGLARGGGRAERAVL